MVSDDKARVMGRVAEVAALAGIKGKLDGDGDFGMGFELERGRTQMAFARYMGQAGGRDVVMFFSQAKCIKTGWLKGLSRAAALELLRLNSKVYFARFGIWEAPARGELMIVASLDHLLDTLDPEELRAAVWSVAQAADNYEREHGGGDAY